MTNVSPTGRPAACHYCGLPIAGGAAQARSPSAEEAAIEGKTTRKGFPRQLTDEPRFCCSGCRFASAITAAGGADAQARWMMTRLGIAIFFSMNVMVFTFLLWSQAEGEAAGGGSGRGGALWPGKARLPPVFGAGPSATRRPAGRERPGRTAAGSAHPRSAARVGGGCSLRHLRLRHLAW